MKSNFFFKKKLKITDIYPKLKIKKSSLINGKAFTNCKKNDLTFDNINIRH